MVAWHARNMYRHNFFPFLIFITWLDQQDVAGPTIRHRSSRGLDADALVSAIQRPTWNPLVLSAVGDKQQLFDILLWRNEKSSSKQLYTNMFFVFSLCLRERCEFSKSSNQWVGDCCWWSVFQLAFVLHWKRKATQLLNRVCYEKSFISTGLIT